MHRGEIRLVHFEPAVGSEVDERRPVVIVSNDGANTAAADLRRGVVTVVPLTSNVTRVFPFQVLLAASDTGLDLDSLAQAEQVRAVDMQRVGPRLGELTAAQLLALDDALRLHLAL